MLKKRKEKEIIKYARARACVCVCVCVYVYHIYHGIMFIVKKKSQQIFVRNIRINKVSK